MGPLSSFKHEVEKLTRYSGPIHISIMHDAVALKERLRHLAIVYGNSPRGSEPLRFPAKRRL